MVTGFVSPIPRSVDTVGELGQYSKLSYLTRELKVIPRFGKDLGFSAFMTDIVKSLSSLSPSQTACANHITGWTIGNILDVKRDTIPGLREFSDGDSSVSQEEKIKFANQLADIGITFLDIISFLRSIEATQISVVSEAYVRITVITVGGTTKVYFKVLDYSLVHVLESKRPKIMYGSLFQKTWDKQKPKFYNVTEYGHELIWKRGANKLEAVVRIGEERHGFYAKPKASPILMSMYNEIVLTETTTKLVGSEFIAKALVAFEAENPRVRQRDEDDSAFQMAAKAMREITTVRHGRRSRNGSTVLMVEYPHGNKAPVVEKFGVNRDTAWMLTVQDLASTSIYEAHRWAMQLTGRRDFKSGIGGNILMDLYITKDEELIRPKQVFYEQFMSYILNEVGNITGNKFDYTIAPVQYIKELVERLGEVQKTN